MSKSILENINSGFSPELTLAKPEAPPEKPFISITVPESAPEPQSTFLEIKIDIHKKEHYTEPKIEITIHEKLDLVLPDYEVTKTEEKSPLEDSILDEINTGFGPENTLTKPECPELSYFTHLYKENHLSEFISDYDKELARTNLGIYSKAETVTLISESIDLRIESLIESLGTLIELNFTKGNPQYSILYNLEIRQLLQLGIPYIPVTEARAVAVNTLELVANSGKTFPDLGIVTLSRVLKELFNKISINEDTIATFLSEYVDKYSAITAETVKVLNVPVRVEYSLNWLDIYGIRT